ncbi:MAG: zinc-ribbon domain-containing protein [Nitrospinales bacterium]
MFCGNCGTENPDEANFCTQCGTPTKNDPDSQTPQQYRQPGQPSPYQQSPQFQRPDMKETFKHSAVSGAGTYAGCCCMNALSNMLCDMCE